jgi:hypothetical protein
VDAQNELSFRLKFDYISAFMVTFDPLLFKVAEK